MRETSVMALDVVGFSKLMGENPEITLETLSARRKVIHEIKDKIVNDAKEQANSEADKILTSAKEQINNEKLKAITELKNSVAELSIDIAEKVLRSELADKAKQEALVSNALKESELN